MKLGALSYLACVVLVGCGGEGGDGKGSSGGTSGETSSGAPSGGSTSGAPADAGPVGTPAPTPKTIASPKLDHIMKMTGALHVVWELPADTTCDKIEGERKSATEAYKVVWTVPGTVDNKHDGTATKATMYTYRLRCKVGTEYSEYSNELGKNPQ